MSLIAPILEQTHGKIRFCVDDVEPAKKHLSLQTAKYQFEKTLQSTILAFSHSDTFQVIQDRQIHPLALAVHIAFSEHRPLLLTPDAIWIAIAQGFAQHINNHVEELRSRFVRHQGKAKLIVARDGLPTLPQHWAEVIQEWTLHIRDRVGADVYKLIECNFSTTTPITHTASHVVMMDAFQQYFDYVLMCICGIPNVTLLGTVEDWQSIYDRVQNIAQYNLNWWTDRLLPICREFINTASGKPSLEFWQCIYKPEAAYAAEYITGWLADLFPYLQHGITNSPTVRNKLLDLNRCELPSFEETNVDGKLIDSFKPVHQGISLNSLPLGISKVVLELKAEDPNGQQEYDLELVAGFIGVYQDLAEGTLQPEIGWAVHEQSDRFRKLLDTIQREHTIQPPIDWSTFDLGFFNSFPKEFIQMLERFDGAILYADSGHSWQILPYQSWAELHSDEGYFGWDRPCVFMNLEDGRSIAFVEISGKYRLLLGQKDSGFEGSCVIAKSITQFFTQIFESEGSYYFDDLSFEMNSLEQVMNFDRNTF